VKKCGRDRQATDDNVIWRMRFACLVIKATDTHSEYAIINAFRRQQWLCERASMLCLCYIACVFIHNVVLKVSVCLLSATVYALKFLHCP
jgi:hypothetical protein